MGQTIGPRSAAVGAKADGGSHRFRRLTQLVEVAGLGIGDATWERAR
jgi:hypothetical protein